MSDKKEVKRYDILFSHYQRYLKNLLRNYFIWEGLPETIDKRALEGSYTQDTQSLLRRRLDER